VTTHAPLRSRRTKAQSVCHVQGVGDGDFPTSPLKDTRLLAVACKPLFGNAFMSHAWSLVHHRWGTGTISFHLRVFSLTISS
jgi:hypothetical protein